MRNNKQRFEIIEHTILFAFFKSLCVHASCYTDISSIPSSAWLTVDTSGLRSYGVKPSEDSLDVCKYRTRDERQTPVHTRHLFTFLNKCSDIPSLPHTSGWFVNHDNRTLRAVVSIYSERVRFLGALFGLQGTLHHLHHGVRWGAVPCDLRKTRNAHSKCYNLICRPCRKLQ